MSAGWWASGRFRLYEIPRDFLVEAFGEHSWYSRCSGMPSDAILLSAVYEQDTLRMTVWSASFEVVPTGASIPRAESLIVHMITDPETR